MSEDVSFGASPDTQSLAAGRTVERGTVPTAPDLPMRRHSVSMRAVRLLRRLGPYELLGVIGHGGMAEVFLARLRGRMGFEKLVVIKCIHPHLASERYFVDMFLDEARLAARINDPHVVQIYELGDADGVLFIAMEYLEGENLGAVVREARKARTTIQPYFAARIIAGAAAGLHAAHELCDSAGNLLHVVHRDVSPGNIIVLYSGGVKMVDFGVAKARGRIAESTAGEVKGKYAYMSPEQVMGEDVDRRSDVFALGIVLWEALTGRRLFRAENEATTVRLVTDGTVPPPSSLRPGLDPDLDRITLKALARNRDDRYPDAQAMRSELERYVHAVGAPAGELALANYLRASFAERIVARAKLVELASECHDVAEIGPAELDPAFGSEESGEATPDEHPSPAAAMPAITVAWRRRLRLVVVAACGALFLGSAAGVALAIFAGDDTAWGDGPPSAPAATVDLVATATTATVRIAVKPADATVTIDGKAVPGEGPFLVEGLAPGVHQITLSAPGFVAASRYFEAKLGPVSGLELVLEPLAPATLAIRTVPPGATVELNGAAMGITPFELESLRPGVEHEVRVTRTGYEPFTEKVNGRSGEAVTIGRRLEPLERAVAAPPPTGRLFLTTTPWSVVYYGKRKLGETPLLGIKLPPGKRTLRAENPKTGAKKVFSVDIVRGKDTRLSIEL